VTEHSTLRLYQRLIQQARPFWGHLAAISLMSLVATPLALLAPVPLKIVADYVVGSHPLPPLLKAVLPAAIESSKGALLGFACVLLILTTLAGYIQGVATWLLQTYTGGKLVLQFRAQLFRHAQRLSFAYHDSRGTTDSAYRILYDSPSIEYIMIYGLIPLVSALVMLAGMIYITARIDGQVVLVALSATPLLFLFTHVFGKRLKDRWTDLKMMESSANSQVQEVISSMRVVKAFGREEHEHERFIIQSKEKMRMQIRTYLLQGGYDLLIGVSMATATAAVLLLGGLHVLSGRLLLGDLLLMMGYVAQLLEPLKLLSKKLTELQAGLASAERAFALQDEIPDVIEKPDAIPIEKAAGEVTFRDVRFAYTKGNPVLSGISLDVPPGTRVGIQGRTGSGKSTLLSLLVRFYDVDGGQILIDGVDIRDYKLDELRNQFGIVLQEPLLFSTSIAENIAYGKIGAPMEEIVEAAKLANAHDFIAALPEGYDTKVGERGVQLSGGERQRISLARAFLKDAPILILDEPTSSVDTATEGLIMDAMERLMRGRTTFMIAHRIATLKDCDIRVEMRDGHLVEVIAELRDADRVGVV